MDWRKAVDDQGYRRRRPSAGAIHRFAFLPSGSRIIAALLAGARQSAPSRKAAEYEDGGYLCQFARRPRPAVSIESWLSILQNK
jgi:hypothetical protein